MPLVLVSRRRHDPDPGWGPLLSVLRDHHPLEGRARLTRIKIRRIDDGKPKYAEAYSDRPLIYPDPAVIRPGRPLIVSEGEFDCLLAGPATS